MNNMKSNIRTINSFLADPRSEVRKEQLLKLDRYALEMKSNGKELSFLKYWGASNKNELDKYKKLQANFKKNRTKGVLIRFDVDDLTKIKMKAEAEGLPYQTFIKSIIHKVASK